jgi:hypothetical protein
MNERKERTVIDFLYAPEAIELLPWADKFPQAGQDAPSLEDDDLPDGMQGATPAEGQQQ